MTMESSSTPTLKVMDGELSKGLQSQQACIDQCNRGIAALAFLTELPEPAVSDMSKEGSTYTVRFHPIVPGVLATDQVAANGMNPPLKKAFEDIFNKIAAQKDSEWRRINNSKAFRVSLGALAAAISAVETDRGVVQQEAVSPRLLALGKNNSGRQTVIDSTSSSQAR